jgi:predicted ATPase/class 3 adenylate cyclase/DNA-binding CsgD family transcriptional regulator
VFRQAGEGVPRLADLLGDGLDDAGSRMVDDVCRGVGRPLLVEPGVIEGEPRAFTLPTGTVTFLLTDVEGSTRRWEAAPEAMAVAIARHYDLLDDAIAANGGVRPVEQGEGDSVVAAFSRASDAVGAVLAAQRAFGAEAWPAGAELEVRMAVHTGEVQLRGEGNYVGQTLNRCARLRGIGHGGQVLVSAATAGVLADRLGDGVTLRDLGLHRLRDLGRPEHVWQLVAPDLRPEFGPLRSLDAYRHNLPVQLTPLVGRLGEITELRALFGEERLVTLVGSAGVGKTRLALAASADLLDRYPGGVWWVELAAVSDHDAIGRAALAALGAQQVTGSSLAHQLAVELGDEPSLIALDNCEHVITSCALFVAALLSAGPTVTVLATSREPLGVPGEVIWRVPSLPCPGPDLAVSVPALSQYDAVTLFVDRAHRARPSFAVDDRNAAAVAQICHRLDGIPLAIELAAARCRQTSAERIAAELDDRFRYLTGGARTVMPRQQTLAASVDWSYERLDDAERLAFRRLGVFAGPFPLEAAEAVVASPGDIDRDGVFDLISRLVDKSLVVADDATGGPAQYRLLETLRAYAVTQAHSVGELVVLRDTHATWWTDWLEPRWAMPSDETLEAAQQFHGNLVAALEWSVADPSHGLTLLSRLGRIWTSTSRAGDATNAIDRLLTDDNALHHAPAWLSAATETALLVFRARGITEASALVERVEHVARDACDDYHAALARVLVRVSRSDLELIRDLARERDDGYLEAEMTIQLASLVGNEDPVAAAPLLADLTRQAATIQGGRSRQGVRLAAAMASRSTGDLRTSIEQATAVLDDGFPDEVGDAINTIATAALLAGDEQALRLAGDRAVDLRRKNPGLALVADNINHRLDLLCGEDSIVDHDLAAADSSWPMTSATLWVVGREAIDAGAPDTALTGVRALAGDSPHDRAVLAALTGAATGDEDAWHTALHLAVEHDLRLIAVDALEGLAATAAGTDSWAECLRLLAAGQRLRDELEYRWRFRFEQAAVDTAHRLASDNLDETAAGQARTEGHDLEWHAAAAYARRARGERKRPRHGWASLTPTEQQVVVLVADGLTNAQIATRLLMGRATVKTHLAHIFNKLDVTTRAQLAGESARRAPQ